MTFGSAVPLTSSLAMSVLESNCGTFTVTGAPCPRSISMVSPGWAR
jgi:hypothetical protein